MCVPDETLTELVELCNIITGIIKGEKKANSYISFTLFIEKSLSALRVLPSQKVSQSKRICIFVIYLQNTVYISTKQRIALLVTSVINLPVAVPKSLILQMI